MNSYHRWMALDSIILWFRLGVSSCPAHFCVSMAFVEQGWHRMGDRHHPQSSRQQTRRWRSVGRSSLKHPIPSFPAQLTINLMGIFFAFLFFSSFAFILQQHKNNVAINSYFTRNQNYQKRDSKRIEYHLEEELNSGGEVIINSAIRGDETRRCDLDRI